jgi:hypothetical protein
MIPILGHVFRALSLEGLSNSRPLFAVMNYFLKEGVVFFLGPLLFVEIWVAMVDPSLSAFLEGSEVLPGRLLVEPVGYSFPLHLFSTNSRFKNQPNKGLSLCLSPFFP